MDSIVRGKLTALVLWAALPVPAHRLAVGLHLALPEHAGEARRPALAALAGVFGGNRVAGPEQHPVHVAHSGLDRVSGDQMFLQGCLKKQKHQTGEVGKIKVEIGCQWISP